MAEQLWNSNKNPFKVSIAIVTKSILQAPQYHASAAEQTWMWYMW